MVSKKKIKYRIFCIKRDMGVRLKFLRNKKELRFLRNKKELSLPEVSEACGISVSRIEMIENGRSFSLKHLLMLASVYGVRVKILIK